MRQSDFIIIGAGLAGLSAHHALLKKGYNVITIEASSVPGGRVQTKKIRGGNSDTGAQFFTFGYPRITKLLEELRLEGQPASGLMGHLEQNRDILINTKNPFGAVTSGLLSLSSFLLLVAHMIKLSFSRASAEDPLSLPEEGNALEYCQKYLNQEILEKIFVPYFSAFNYAHPSELSSALVVRALLHMKSGKALMGLPGGLATFSEALSRDKDIHLNTKVLALDGNIVKTDKGDFQGKHIILATTASVAKELLGEKFPEELAVSYKSSVHEAILVKRKPRNGSYGTLVSPSRNPDINVLTNERHKAKNLAPEESDLFAVLRSSVGATKDEVNGLNLLGISQEEVLETKKTIWKEAIPLLGPGHFSAIRRYRENLSKKPTLILAGDYLSTGCAEGAVESGQFAASLF